MMRPCESRTCEVWPDKSRMSPMTEQSGNNELMMKNNWRRHFAPGWTESDREKRKEEEHNNQTLRKQKLVSDRQSKRLMEDRSNEDGDKGEKGCVLLEVCRKSGMSKDWFKGWLVGERENVRVKAPSARQSRVIYRALACLPHLSVTWHLSFSSCKGHICRFEE